MQQGIVPGADILRAIHLQESAELSWLVTGEGRSFRIYNAPDAGDFDTHIGEMLTTLGVQNQGIYLCDDGHRLIVANVREKKYQYRNDTIKYRSWEMASGIFSKPLYDFLTKLFAQTKAESEKVNWFHAVITPAEMTGIVKGERSPLALFGDQKKLEASVEVSPIKSMRTTLKSLLNHVQQTSDSSEVIMPAQLAQVIEVVDAFNERKMTNPNKEQKSKLYSAVYNHCQRTGEAPEQVANSVLPSLLDVI
ncbi:hypothetical protein [Endozoicomonas ascidiicola]|uniref:hypothetical protein n=1 Tax=Endozoicomonas ascidiicola TaxID=1698521 RepID=UPI001C12C5CC|nr:hypothetical protein [Endozoicomonas ascidiicola]